VPKIGVSTHIRTLEPAVIADLDTLLTALYVELSDAIIPSLGFARCGPGRPPEVTDAELACLAVAQVLLRFDDERHWLRAAPKQVGHRFPRLLGCGPASCSACLRSTPPSGTTGKSARPSSAR